MKLPKMTIDACIHHPSSRKLLRLALAMSIAALCANGHAQAPQSTPATQPASQADSTTAKLPTYDVVSIKPNKTGDGNYGIRTGDDSLTATNVSLKFLASMTYGIKPDMISGISGRIDSARFDVIAKIVDSDPAAMKKVSDEQRLAMVLPILMERFQLKAHTEIKILPVYELTVIQDGPKFKQSSDSSQQGGLWNVSGNQGKVTGHNFSMTGLAKLLTDVVHRTVIDKTGLTGNYELELKWSQDVGSDSNTGTGPSIFTALQEQLGLKLKPAKGPVETLVVDHAAMPSAN